VFIKQNTELLNNTIADWIMQGRSSLEFFRGTITPTGKAFIQLLEINRQLIRLYTIIIGQLCQN